MPACPNQSAGEKCPRGELPAAGRTVAALLFTAGCLAFVLLITLDGGEPRLTVATAAAAATEGEPR